MTIVTNTSSGLIITKEYYFFLHNFGKVAHLNPGNQKLGILLAIGNYPPKIGKTNQYLLPNLCNWEYNPSSSR